MKKLFKNVIGWSCSVVILFLSCILLSGVKNDIEYFAKADGIETTNKAFAKQELNTNEQHLYSYLVAKIEEIAKGEESSTTIVVNESSFISWGLKTAYVKEDVGTKDFNGNTVANMFLNQFDFDLILSALIHDLPYELYWFDKTSNYQTKINIETITQGATLSQVNISEFVILLKVSNGYKISGYNEEYPMVDTAKTLAASNVLNNAKAIVNNYRELKDYQKLMAYKNKICELVTYNEEAASGSYSGGYGDPWQVIYVFDNDPETNVVCEGYAKAFQLLCNLSTFEDEHIKCYTVSGVTVSAGEAGSHMWNVVVMDDECSYIADITNSDEGSIGKNGDLFIQEYNSYDNEEGYSFNIGIKTLFFNYNQKTKDLWGTTAESVLNLSSEEYQIDHPTISITLNEEIVYDKNEVSAGLKGLGEFDVEYTFDNHAGEESLYSWTHEWHESYHGHQGELMSSVPKNVGTYWIKVIATSKANSNYSIVHYQEIVINPKTLTVKNVRGENREFDDTNNISLTNIELLGVMNGDVVDLNIDNISATINGVNVGTYKKVNISNLSLVGADKSNYRISSTLEDVSMITLTISATTPRVTENFTKVKKSGKKLVDLDIEFDVKGVSNQHIDGVVVWIDDEGNDLDVNTLITKGTNYKYKFTPNDSNYSEYVGSVMLWGEEDKEFFNKEDLPKIIEYSLYGLVFIIILSFTIVAIKRIVKKKKESK